MFPRGEASETGSAVVVVQVEGNAARSGSALRPVGVEIGSTKEEDDEAKKGCGDEGSREAVEET